MPLEVKRRRDGPGRGNPACVGGERGKGGGGCRGWKSGRVGRERRSGGESKRVPGFESVSQTAIEKRGRLGSEAIAWATYKIDERHGGSIISVEDWWPAGRANWMRAGL